METRRQRITVRGIIAGLVGAITTALWFFFLDGSEGQLLRTPAFLASVVLRMGTGDASFVPVAAYSVLHGAAFIAVGLGVSWFLHRFRDVPTVGLAIVLGVILFVLIAYAGVFVTGVNVVDELDWAVVLTGNLLAAGGMVGYLHLVGATRPIQWWTIPWDNRIFREATACGVIGAAVVAVWFLLIDFALGRPLFTPAALGSALFLGATEAGQVTVNFATVAGYSVFHIGAFVLFGAIASAIVTVAEERPPLVLGAVLLFVVFEAMFMGFLAMGVEFLLGVLQWWAIAIGNLLAALAMGYYLWAQHPKLREAMAADPFDHTD